MRVVERKIKHLPDINQVCIPASAGHQSGAYREKSASTGHQSGDRRYICCI